MRIKKLDEELQLVYGEVYAPGFPDAQGDFMTSETIRKMAHRFMEQMRVAQIDRNHDSKTVEATVVESFIARKGDPDFIADAWVAGVHIRDAEVWDSVKKGDINGFSVEGGAIGRNTEIEIEVPEQLGGATNEVEGHEHRFTVFFDDEGQFLGGHTDEVNGHSHQIVKGTVTEQAAGHRHRFSYYEGLIDD